MLPPGEKSYQPPQSSATNRLNTERIEEQGGRGSVLLSDPQAWGLLLGCGRTALGSLSRKGRDRVLDRSSTLIIAGRALVSVPAPCIPPNDICILRELLDMAGSGVMSIPNIGFEMSLTWELRTTGASGPGAETYIKGVQGGGVLLFATGSNEKMYIAADIMNRHGSRDVCWN